MSASFLMCLCVLLGCFKLLHFLFFLVCLFENHYLYCFTIAHFLIDSSFETAKLKHSTALAIRCSYRWNGEH